MVRKLINNIFLLLPLVGFSQYGNFLFNQHGNLSAIIDTNTYVNLIFDNSSSMNSTLAPLIEMRDDYLLDSLIGFYNNDTALYESRVNVIEYGGERTFGIYMLNRGTTALDISNNIKIVNIVYQDESSPYGAYRTYPITRVSNFEDDIASLRDSTVSFVSTLKYTGVVFQVAYPYPAFKSFIDSVENGGGNYAVPYGLPDRSDQFVYYYDITEGDTAVYYTNLLMAALRDLGFDL